MLPVLSSLPSFGGGMPAGGFSLSLADETKQTASSPQLSIFSAASPFTVGSGSSSASPSISGSVTPTGDGSPGLSPTGGAPVNNAPLYVVGAVALAALLLVAIRK